MLESTCLSDHFLIAMPNLSDPNFHQTVTYICEHDDNGALGIIINRPLNLEFGELLEHLQLQLSGRSELASATVFSGGPVSQEKGFVMGGLDYSLSPEVAAQIQDEMLEAALEKLTARAQRAAKALGKSKAELKEINTQGNYLPQARMSYARMELLDDGGMEPPSASPGETTITMTVSAKALLR